MEEIVPEKECDQPLTPAGRLFLQPNINQIIHCVIGVQNPIDIDAVKAEIASSVMLKHPRFSSLLVVDRRGREHWRRTQVNVDQHVIVLPDSLTRGDGSIPEEDAVNDYLADLSVSTPLSTDKPLWEIHLLMAHNCGIFRLHHALGDGISLMSTLLSCCRRADDPTRSPTFDGVGGRQQGSTIRWSFCRIIKMIWYTLIFVMELILRSLWLKDKKTTISGGDGVELWPRKLVTAKFRIDDMKTVKRAVANATINDVLFGVISCGISRYLDVQSTEAKDLKEGVQITGIAMVNLRPQPGLQKVLESKRDTWFGNQFGMIALPIYYHKGGSDPLQFVRRAKAMIDKKKLSLEALFSYKIGDLVMSCFGPKMASCLNYRIISNTTFTISNVIGPREEITIVGNPVTYLRVNSTSLPHAITMHMVSYAGKADLQILAAKDIVLDPKLLAKCFEDALCDMKNAAEAEHSSR